jgi:hypothetical protein
MISNSNKISNVISKESENEYFFLYDKKHKWSVRLIEDSGYFIYYYRGERALNEIADFSGDDWKNFAENYITYSSKELKTTESLESMQELYRIVKEKSLGMDDVLSDIIDSDDSEADEIPF